MLKDVVAGALCFLPRFCPRAILLLARDLVERVSEGASRKIGSKNRKESAFAFETKVRHVFRGQQAF
jgi:hypothetical protein